MGYMYLFQFWFPQGICLGVGLLGDGKGDESEFQKGGDICIPMADSCCSLTENSKIL